MNIKQIRDLLARITPGPWRWGDWSANFGTVENPERMVRLERNLTHQGAEPYRCSRADGRYEVLPPLAELPEGNTRVNAEFIAASPTVARTLLALLPNATELAGLRAVHFNAGPYGSAAEAYAERIVEALWTSEMEDPEVDPRRVHSREMREQRDAAIRERDAWKRSSDAYRDMADERRDEKVAIENRLTTELAAARVERDAALDAQREAASERDRLFLRLNTPHTANFLEAVTIEAAHQVERWGVEHDQRKSVEDWAALFVRLLGKMVDAHWNGNIPKLFHHVVTLAAVASNCHASLTARLDAVGRARVAALSADKEPNHGE